MDDVLVVGAGPAGSTAALVLARAGARVRIIDRAQFPRDKLCGDTLNPGTVSIVERLGVREAISRRALPISGMTVTGPGGARVSAEYPDGFRGIAIRRRDLDDLLLNAAIAAGAEFEAGVSARGPLLASDGVRVEGVQCDTFPLRARVVIGAEGRHARLAFALGLSRFAVAPRRWAFGAYFSDVGGLRDRGEMHIRADGYVGVAPLPGGLANVCVVREIRRLRAPGSGLRSVPKPEARSPKPDRIIAEAIADDPELRARFDGATRVSPPTILGPLAIESSAAGCPGLLLAGDAAGFIDPMTGDGLRFALRGGELAAEAALRELASGAPAFAALTSARAAEFAGKWRLNRGLRRLVASPRGVRLAATIASQWAAPLRVVIDLAGDVPLARAAHRAAT
jgi:flavin-dependent dehydrogenase